MIFRHPPLETLMGMELLVGGPAIEPGAAPLRLDLTPQWQALLACGYVATVDEDRASLWLSTGREAARKIGWDLHRMGQPGYPGFQIMLAVHDAISRVLSPLAARELEAAWHQVGEWRD
jgi:hypothetical protein